MRVLEIVFVLIVLGFLLAQNVRVAQRRHVLALAVAGLAVLMLSVLLGQARWQMTPAYLLFGCLCLLLPRRGLSHVAVRAVGVSLGVIFLLTSVIASLGMPILTLPAPSGPHVVGTTSFSLLDETRDYTFFGRPDEARELYVQIWYPGAIVGGQSAPRVRTLWQELYRGDLDRFTVFTRYLRGIETHSYEDIPMSAEQASYPVILFSHAMGSFAEQSTLLMEHLASHGFIVLAASQRYSSMRSVPSDGEAVYIDFDKINEISAPYDAEATDAAAPLEQASAEERVTMQLERYERADGLNALMATWVDDLRFVLDALTASSSGEPKLQAISQRIDSDRIGLLGMSFGGGAITELCKTDARCRAGLNMDGGTFGERQRQPLEVPYLALVKENEHALDYLLPTSRSDFYRVEVAGATHLDFTDDTVVLPILKWLGVTGSIGGERVTEITNAVSLRFFDAYLRGGAEVELSDFPELTVQTNAAAAR
jgi:predicted dienelactone hydrolase